MFITRITLHIAAWLPFIWLVYAALTRQLGGDPQEKMLHDLGLWGLIFLLLCLTMTPARIFLKKEPFKKIPWIKFRRMLGLYAAFYLFLHWLVYLFFFLSFDFNELLNEVIKRPYITVGMLAFVGLLPLVFTSTKKSQKRLGKNWKKLHQLVYLIAGLGLVHFIWQSKSDLNEPLLYVMWALILGILRFINNKNKRAACSKSNSKVS